MDKNKLVKAATPRARSLNFRAKFTSIILAETKTENVAEACKALDISRQTFYNIVESKSMSDYTAWKFSQRGMSLPEILKRAERAGA